MSDAQFPPDAGDENNGRQLRPGLRLSEAGMIAAARQDVLEAGSLKEALAITSSANGGDQRRQDTLPSTGRLDAGGHSPLAGDAVYDNQQPMLDLGLPDLSPRTPPSLPTLPEAHNTAFDRSLTEHPDRGLDRANFAPLPAPQFAPPNSGQAPHAEASQTSVAADVQVEVSPIFSALDAAEKRAEEADLRAEAAGSGPFGSSLLTPSPLPTGDALAASSTDALPEQHSADDSMAAGPGQVPASGTGPLTAADAAAHGKAQQAFFGEEPGPAGPVLDAAAKIAAEASATAEALDNLKRLLVHKLPNLDFATVPRQTESARERAAAPPPIPPVASLHLRADPPPVAPAAALAPLLPLPVPPEHDDRTGIYVRGFLAGLGLSLVAGIVLYLFIGTG